MLPIFYFTSLYVKPGIWSDAPWTFLGATLPSIICLLCSNAYHTMMPLPSQQVYNRLLFIDYLSVFNVMIWPTAILINGSFPCFGDIRVGLLAAYLAFSLAMLVLAVRAKNNVQRLVPFAFLSGARLCLQGGRAWVGQARYLSLDHLHLLLFTFKASSSKAFCQELSFASTHKSIHSFVCQGFLWLVKVVLNISRDYALLNRVDMYTSGSILLE
jgi:hypothetical protein